MESEMEIEIRGQESEGSYQLSVINKLKLFTVYCLLFTVVTGCGQKAEEDGIRKTLPKEGDVAAAFSLKLIDGKEFKLSDAKGKPVIINFFASWCHPCRTEAPALQKVYAKYKQPPQSPFNKGGIKGQSHFNKGGINNPLNPPLTKGELEGVIFIGVAIQDTEKKAKAYVKEFGIQFPVGIDSAGNIAEAYKVYGIPKTFIIDKDGRFSYIHMGEITETDLIKGIEKALK